MWRAAQDALLRKYSSDRSCKDPSRVFRVPGFYHQKKAPHQATIIHYETVTPYSIEQIGSSSDLKLNTHLVEKGGRSVNAPVMTKEQVTAAKKYSNAAAATLGSDVDEYDWETPDQIQHMLSFLPSASDGVRQDWHLSLIHI